MTLQINRSAVADAPHRPIPLGHDAVLTVRVLDAIDHKLVLAEARAELNALVAGDETKHAWPSLDARLEKIRASEEARSAALSWMHAVLLATASAVSLDGVVDENKQKLPPAFETFELLFNDAGVEIAFRTGSGKTEQLWDAEKNGSRPGPNGSGPEVSNSAALAKKPATPAPVADADTTEADAPSAVERPEQQKANSPGRSPAQPDAGPSQD